MLLYIAIAFWIAAMVFSLSEGQRRLPSLSLLTGCATIWLMNNGGQTAVGLAILSALGLICFINSKLAGLRASR